MTDPHDNDEPVALVINTRPTRLTHKVGGGLDGSDHTHRQGRLRPKLQPSRDVGR